MHHSNVERNCLYVQKILRLKSRNNPFKLNSLNQQIPKLIFRFTLQPAFRLDSSVTAESFSSLREVSKARDLILTMITDRNKQDIGNVRQANRNGLMTRLHLNSSIRIASETTVRLIAVKHKTLRTKSQPLLRRRLRLRSLIHLFPFRHRTARTTSKREVVIRRRVSKDSLFRHLHWLLHRRQHHPRFSKKIIPVKQARWNSPIT